MGSELPGTVAMPGAVGAGQVRMGGAVPGRGGKRRSGGMDFDDEDGEGPSKFSSVVCMSVRCAVSKDLCSAKLSVASRGGGAALCCRNTTILLPLTNSSSSL
ncbi:aryl hydrocarbon receptor nuclear translocator 2-like [Notothenia coriiceps]|uniref:Aryl hydrocarbon receptor nuclear translocator 2-like n=1 Tax=Notothenia coriiceps TaxID=8208 RepID=A0A6I9MWX8_9TELE|nr:PREDICTED: aryl hydrocarbon receptor nuclear translocator 2-like [Notothenia coriiceps]